VCKRDDQTLTFIQRLLPRIAQSVTSHSTIDQEKKKEFNISLYFLIISIVKKDDESNGGLCSALYAIHYALFFKTHTKNN